MDPVLLALIAVVTASLKKVIYRSCLKGGSCLWAVAILYNISGGLLLLPFLSLSGIENINALHCWLLFASTLLWVCGYYLDLKSFQHIAAVEAEIYGALRLVLLVLVGIVLFNESLSSMELAGMLIIIAAIGANYCGNGLTLNKGAFFQLLSCLFSVAAIALDKHLVSMLGLDLVVLCTYLGPGLAFALLNRKAIHRVIPTVRSFGTTLLLAPVFGAVSYYCYLWSAEVGSLASSTIIFRLGIVFVFLFEVFFLKERASLIKRSASCLLCTFGALLVCL